MSFLSTLASSIPTVDVRWLPLAGAALKASVLLGVAGAVTAALHRTSAAVRHMVWTLALVGALVVPALSAALPRWELPLVRLDFESPATFDVQAPAVARPPGSPHPALATPVVERGDSLSATPPAGAPSYPGGVPLRWETAFLSIWLAGFLLIVSRLVIGMVTVHWMSRHTDVVTDAGWLPLARRLAGDLGVSPRVRFLQSRRATMPLAWGIVRPAVLMPADADGWPVARIRVVLLHELAHVRRGDCLTHLLAQAACAVHWFNPLAWMAARRARAERERACDDLVLTSGTRGSEYAEELLQMARGMRSGRFPAMLAGATLAMAHRSQLEGRLIAILDPTVPRTGLTRARAVAASIACLCAFAPLAAMQPWTDGRTDIGSQAPAVMEHAIEGPAGDIVPPTLESAVPRERAVRAPSVAGHTRSIGQTVPAAPPQPAQPAARAPRILRASAGTVSSAAIDAAVSAALEGVEGLIERVQAGTSSSVSPRPPSPNPQPSPAPQPATNTPSPSAKSPAADAQPAARRVDPRTLAALTLALEDTDKEVRATAMHALARLHDPSVFEPLVKALADISADVREQAAAALGTMHDKRAVEPLIAALKDTNADVREQIVAALAQLRDPRAADAMIAALKDSKSDVRQQAAFALGQLRDPKVTAALSAAIGDADADVREQIVFALGQLRDASALAALTTALRDLRPSVREQAAFALGQIRDRGSVDPLTAALKDSSADVRQQAAFALGQIKDPRVVEALVLALKDADSDVREQAAFALGQLRDPRAIDGLTTALKDTSASVRRQAAFALGQLAR